MSQCVPSWDLDLNNLCSKPHFISPDFSMLDYEVVAELTWENGQLAIHGLGQPRVPVKPLPPASETTWEKPRAGGTLESIVDQATNVPKTNLPFNIGSDELVPLFEHHRNAAAISGTGASATVTMDALVPCSNRSNNDPAVQQLNSVSEFGTCVVRGPTHVSSCIGAVTQITHGSATLERESQHVTVDTLGFTSTSGGSPENTNSANLCSKTTTGDDHDSVCHIRRQREAWKEEDKKKGNNRKSSVSTKRNRAAAIHNQSERKRRDKINQRMKTLQKMVPNSSKTDKASMLDEVIEYLKQLQAQINMMGIMNMSPMMFPLAMQQQLQMSMITPMGMGIGMGMGVMDMNPMGRHNMTGISPLLHPSSFMPFTSWDGYAARQSQPMTMDTYSRMAAKYQQLHQPPGSCSKSYS